MLEKIALFLCVGMSLFASSQNQEQVVRQCRAHLLIGDPKSALNVASKALEKDPTSSLIHEVYIKCLAHNHRSTELYAVWEQYFKKFPDKAYQRELLEEMGWAMIEEGTKAGAITTRLISLIGAALTQDVKAVSIIEKGLNDSNAVLRKVSSELACHFGDASLQKEVVRRFGIEKKLEVRKSLIKAVAALRIDELIPKLFHLLASKGAPIDEKIEALQGLVLLEEGIGKRELHLLATHERAIFRQLASQIIARCALKEEELLKTLVRDAHPMVAAHALKAMGFARIKATETYLTLAESVDPVVALTAGWALLITDPDVGQSVVSGFLNDSREHVQILAAAAIKAAGPFGGTLAKANLREHKNLVVRLNLALACLEQRQELEAASLTLSHFFHASTDKWMWGEEVGGLFTPLRKSTLNHSPLIANLPEAMNQKVHLEILNLLAITETPSALQMIKHYLTTSLWDISGVAAELLLEEGDAEALDLVRELLTDSDEKIQVQAALALAIWGRDHSALPTLLQVYPKSDRSQKIRILEALGRIGSHQALPFLVKQLGDPSETLRLIAASVLIQTLNH